jgi:hypothetical protein
LKGWVPDFLLYGDKKNILVEVKPVLEFPEEVAKKIEIALSNEFSKFVPLIIGASCDGRNLGWLHDYGWENAIFTIEGEDDSDDRIGFCSESGSFHDRITGNYNGWGGCDEAPVKQFWNEAGNITRWKPS